MPCPSLPYRRRRVLAAAFASFWTLIILHDASAVATPTTESSDALSQPNLVILFADNLSYHDVSVFRSDDDNPPTTPHIDRLAKQGVKLLNWNSAAALCSASRAALLTGKYPVRTGVYPRVFKPDAVYGLMPNETTLAQLLQQHDEQDDETRMGYATKIVGKWHLGHRDDYLPTSHHGFDSWVGIPYHMSGGSVDGHICKYDQEETMWLPLYVNETIVQQPVRLESLMDVYASESVRFIDENVSRKKPFFLYMAFSHVHQLCAPRDSAEQETCQWAAGAISKTSSATTTLAQPTFGDAVREMDDLAGQILDALDVTGATNNTVVIFTSDNGPWVAEQSCAGQKGPFEGDWLRHHVPQNCTACPHDYVSDPTPQRPRRCVLKAGHATSSHSVSSSSSTSDNTVWDLDGVHCGEDTGLGGVWEANLRMPALVRYPGHIPAGSESHAMISTLDVLPTFLSMIGRPIPHDLDGIDVSRALFGGEKDDESNDNERLLFFWRDGFKDGPLPPPYGRFDVAAVKRGNIKAWFWTKSAHYNDDIEQYHDPPLLFDVLEDPAESHPLNPEDYQSIIDEILEATKRHKESIAWGAPLALATDPKWIPCVNRATGCRTGDGSDETNYVDTMR